MENNKSDSSSPSSAPAVDYANYSAQKGGLQLPAWSRGGIFIALVALASAGYFANFLFHKSAPAVTGDRAFKIPLLGCLHYAVNPAASRTEISATQIAPEKIWLRLKRSQNHDGSLNID